MAYTKLNKKDGDTLTGSDMSHIEDGIGQNADDIATINQSLTDYSGIQAPSSSVSSGDLNDDEYTSSYTLLNILFVNSITQNTPRTGNGVVFSIGTTNYGVQLFLSDGGFYIRYKVSGEWGSWVTLDSR